MGYFSCSWIGKQIHPGPTLQRGVILICYGAGDGAVPGLGHGEIDIRCGRILCHGNSRGLALAGLAVVIDGVIGNRSAPDLDTEDIAAHRHIDRIGTRAAIHLAASQPEMVIRPVVDRVSAQIQLERVQLRLT